MSSAPIMIVDEEDKPIGQATKQEAWDKGLIHRVVRLMVHNKQDQVLLQHRTPTKDIFPNCWELSAAGHVDAGEEYKEAMRREIEEELGFENLAFTEIGRYRSDETWNGRRFNRFNRCYQAHYDKTPTKLEADKIDGFRWFDIDEVKRLIKDHSDQVTDGLRQVFERYY
jgi:isopentenyldiphosphate isomerase